MKKNTQNTSDLHAVNHAEIKKKDEPQVLSELEIRVSEDKGKPYGAAEACRLLGLHKETLLRLARVGKIPCTRYSARRIRFWENDLLEYVKSGPCLGDAAPSDPIHQAASSNSNEGSGDSLGGEHDN